MYMEGNQRLEIMWTVSPIAIVLWMAIIGGQTLSDVERRDPDAITVDVVAAQWSWRFEYEVTTAEGITTTWCLTRWCCRVISRCCCACTRRMSSTPSLFLNSASSKTSCRAVKGIA